MKKTLFVLLASGFIFSCGNDTKEPATDEVKDSLALEDEVEYVEPEYVYTQFEGLSLLEQNQAFQDTIAVLWNNIQSLDKEIFTNIDALINQLEFNNGDVKSIEYLKGLRDDVANNSYSLDILRAGMNNYDNYCENLNYLISEVKGEIKQTPSLASQNQPYYKELEFEIDSVLNTPGATIRLTRPYDLQAMLYNQFLEENKKELVAKGVSIPEDFPVFCEVCTIYDHLVSLGVIELEPNLEAFEEEE